MIGGRVARVIVRFGANFGGVAFLLAITAERFDATELTALMFIFLWFAIVEAAVAFAHIEPPEIDQRGAVNVVLCGLMALPAMLAVQCRRYPPSPIEVARAAHPMPEARAAIGRLADLYQ